MCFGRKDSSVIPTGGITKLTSVAITTVLSTANIKSLYTLDNCYYCMTPEDIAAILPSVVGSMPNYETDKFDCDDFAVLFKARMSEKYQVNSCGIVIGNALGGTHCWNCIITSDRNIYYIEPQTGEIWDSDRTSPHPSYIGKAILI